MIVYSGLGILVAPVAVVGFLLPIFLEPWVKKHYGVTVPSWCVMSLAASLPFVGMLGLDSMLRRFWPTRRAVDRVTGHEIDILQSHTFMFVPVKWCAYIWMGLAISLWVATRL
jgi:hypothetical protein